MSEEKNLSFDAVLTGRVFIIWSIFNVSENAAGSFLSVSIIEFKSGWTIFFCWSNDFAEVNSDGIFNTLILKYL